MSLRRKLCREELAAVIGHELAHIKRRDTLSRTVGVTMVNAIAALALVLAAVGLAARRRGGFALIAFFDTWGGRLFASHSPLEKRIARLRILLPAIL